MAVAKLSVKAVEESSYLIQVLFKDGDGNAVVPNAVTWTLTDVEGNVINSRTAVVATPASTVNILLSGDDLALGVTVGHVKRIKRILTIQATYTSSYGVNLPLKSSVEFEVENLVIIT